ncbi:MAG TPA: hypothetical protein VGC56_18395 [Allosphingosinicella sp.]
MATRAAAGAAGAEVSIERIFARSFAVLRANSLVAFGMTFVLSAIPMAVISYEWVRLRDHDYGPFGAGVGISVAIVTGLLLFVAASAAQGGLVRLAVAHEEGRRAGVGECFEIGLSRALPLVVTALLSGLGVGVAMLAFLVPGLILYLSWSVATPVVVLERQSPTEALARSQELTRGARWRVFGLQLILWVPAWLLQAGGSRLLLHAAADSLLLSLGGYAVQVVYATLTTTLFTLVRTELYFELRNWKEGPPADRLADVFR